MTATAKPDPGTASAEESAGGGRLPSTIRVLIVAGTFPFVTANRSAANVITHEMTRHIAETKGFEVTFACVGAAFPTVPEAAGRDLEALKVLGVHFVDSPIIGPDAAPPIPSRVRALLDASPARWLAGTQCADQARKLVEAVRPDVVLTVWSEYATDAFHDVGVPVVAYYGNPVHKSQLARTIYNWRHAEDRYAPRHLIRLGKELVVVNAIERAHLKVMRHLSWVGDVAANDAAYYQRKGVRASYIRNMWPSRVREDWESVRDREEIVDPVKIVGNVGILSGTANTYGLTTLARDVLPELRRVLGEGRFEVHIFGGREPHPALRPLLDDRHILIRGFVEELDTEILSSPIFLIANCHDVFKVGHTRFLHAWSLGACVVAFDDCRESMPEIRHGENALLGSSPAELAELVAQASRDRQLRRTIGRGGVETLTNQFAPPPIVAEIAETLREAVNGGVSSPHV